MTNVQPLQGQRILVTGLDLEQREHRGIAVFSKALIRHLRLQGAEVWLLTQFRPAVADLRALPPETKQVIISARTLDGLVHGPAPEHFWLEGRLPGIGRLARRMRQVLKALEVIRRPRRFRRRDMHSFRLSELTDNPNLRITRLNYLQDVEGIVSIKNLYFASQLAALMNRQRPVEFDASGFDAFITCCPLNLKPLNTPVFLQTVHDVIALEYAPHNENMRQFSHRLQACLSSRRLHVSTSTQVKFSRHIAAAGALSEHQEDVLVQPPSLQLPPLLEANSPDACDLLPSTYWLQRHRKNGLAPFRYLLFNSSVEARKNLLFLVKAFAESGLGRQGIRLCVTGKLKSDSYSQAVREIVRNEPAILLTGYVDETAKLDLYLNALALLSPSLVEGFGIPVLDAACLGLPAIASACDAHREIHDLHDFSSYVLPLGILESRDWADAMRSTAELNLHLAEQAEEERGRRLKRYQTLNKTICSAFQNQLAELIKPAN